MCVGVCVCMCAFSLIPSCSVKRFKSEYSDGAKETKINERIWRPDHKPYVICALRSPAHPAQCHAVPHPAMPCRYLKAKRKTDLAEASKNDPLLKELEEKAAYEDFLQSGGYHGASGTTATSDASGGGEDVPSSQEEGEAGADGGAAEDEDAEEAEVDSFGVSWWTEQRDREQSEADLDVRWLRERGYPADTAREALASAPVAASADSDAVRARRSAALATLQSAARENANFETDVDAAEATAEREEEREGLAAIFDEEFKALGGEDVAVPVTAFEPVGADAPLLVVELYMDPVAAAGYPLGGGLPLIAPAGGGLLEEELHELTEALVAHAVENIDLGPLAFELSSLAEEKANELVKGRRPQKRVKQKQKKKPTKPKGAEREYTSVAQEKAADHAHKARSSNAQTLLAAVLSGKPVPKPDAGGGDGGGGGSGGGGSALAAAVTKTAGPAAPEAFDDLFGGTDNVDKGGYKSKKKKKK